MRVVLEVPDDVDQEQLRSIKDCARTGRFIMVRRPDGLSNEQCGSFIAQALYVLEGMVTENALLEKPDLALIH